MASLTAATVPEDHTSTAVTSRAGRPEMVTKDTKIANKQKWVVFTEAPEKGEVVSGFQYGQELAFANDGGTIYAVSNKLPPTGQPATFGELSGKGVIKEPITGTEFSLKSGKVVGKWCPSLVGNLFGLLIKEQDVPTFQARKKGNKVEALINVNAKAQFEQQYWRGVLDAQGKVDGGYY
jgi:nitrite reductase/ring-hydroxylating ferredoxin subunit